MIASTMSQPAAMRRFFDSGSTRSYQFRKEQLQKLKRVILEHEEGIYEALHQDLKKSREESWVTEVGFVVAEINHAIRRLRQWMAPERAGTNLVNFPSSSRVLREPKGVVLIIGPWNYPFMLLMDPLVGAIAAGNCAVVKPSEQASATEKIIQQILERSFSSEYVRCITGDGSVVVPELLSQHAFDHLFFTGSTSVGRKVYQQAAEKLIPVTLELGGKSPVIVERDANINVAAKRITITKFSNAGQMCVAPEYVLVHEDVKDKLVQAIQETIPRFFSQEPEESYNYCRIINAAQFDRLTRYLQNGKIIYGGRSDRDRLYIEPTILDAVSPEDPVMNEEIFGPILPVLTFRTREEAAAIVKRHPYPLAFYLFTSNRRSEQKWLEEIPFGGGCINNASWHLTNYHLPFGGRNFSGIGHYHGKYSFDTFSHLKGIMRTPTWFDPAIKYPPFQGKLRLFRWIIR